MMKRGCTQCGECLNVCPVFREFMREEYAPKAKRILLEPLDKEYGPDSTGGAADPDLAWERVQRLAKLCAGCGRCDRICARKLSTPALLADARAGHPHWSQHLWELWVRHMGPLWPTVGFAASLLPSALTPAALESSLAPARALVNKRSIRPWARVVPASEANSGVALLFSGCTAGRVRKEWRQKAEALLERFGYSLGDASGFDCCGGTMRQAGQYKAMQAMREKNVAVWKAQGKPLITVFCASCLSSLQEYENCFADDDEAAAWKKSLQPLSALLAGAKAEPLAKYHAEELPESFGYHQPCHWPVDKDLPFLQALFGGLHKGTGLCCGMGGILKMSNPDLSMRMAKTCLQGFPEGTDMILTGCSGCALQLACAAPEGTRVCHWLDVVS